VPEVHLRQVPIKADGVLSYRLARPDSAAPRGSHVMSCDRGSSGTIDCICRTRALDHVMEIGPGNPEICGVIMREVWAGLSVPRLVICIFQLTYAPIDYYNFKVRRGRSGPTRGE
jgi:hypothetical protein